MLNGVFSSQITYLLYTTAKQAKNAFRARRKSIDKTLAPVFKKYHPKL